MSTYIIGDVQGCYQQLLALLEALHFSPEEDRLGFVGDLVNRGPESLSVLRFIKGLKNPLVVLGNHDLHLLAVGYGQTPIRPTDTFQDVLNAPDKMELLDWLRQQSILRIHQNHLLVHAGIPPQWSIEQAVDHAKILEAALQGPNYLNFLQQMHGNQPTLWQNDLNTHDRLRYLTNAFTRLRFCSAAGELDLTNKTTESTEAEKFKPWFEFRDDDQETILFGHWAALEGRCKHPNITALDTGCVWGGALSAYVLEEKSIRQYSRN